jgi:uncharacterized membrane protein
MIQTLRTQRLPVIDALRGIALVAMIIFHASWNLDAFRFTQMGVVSAPAWLGFAKTIAGSFLVLTGLSLALADDAGHSTMARLKRIGRIALAAALVSVATYYVFPNAFVYFGILHHIALAGLIAWPLLRVHWLLIVGLAAAIVFINHTVALDAADTRWLAWIGLSRNVPPTNDYVPVFPWFALVLAGLLLARIILARPALMTGLQAQPSWTRPLVWMGRHSLMIYLIHQPVLFGLATLAYTLTQQ